MDAHTKALWGYSVFWLTFCCTMASLAKSLAEFELAPSSEPEGLGHEQTIITLQRMQGVGWVESCMEPCSFPELM